MKENNPIDQLDILLRMERLTEELNRMMSSRSQSVFKRYPLTFMLVALFGVVAVSEGVKGLLAKLSFLDGQPLYLLAVGLFILIVLGSVYKKLDK